MTSLPDKIRKLNQKIQACHSLSEMLIQVRKEGGFNFSGVFLFKNKLRHVSEIIKLRQRQTRHSKR